MIILKGIEQKNRGDYLSKHDSKCWDECALSRAIDESTELAVG